MTHTDTLEETITQARAKLHVAKTDVQAADRALQLDPGLDAKIVNAARERAAAAQAALNGLMARQEREDEARRAAERAARLAEASRLEARAKELRALCD